MKRRLRSSIFLFFFLAVIAMFSFGSVLRRGLRGLPQFDDAALLYSSLHASILFMSTEDPGADDLMRDVDALLSSDLTFSDIGFGRDHLPALYLRGTLPATSASRIRFPIRIGIPRDFGIVPVIRRSLRKWLANTQFDAEILSHLPHLVKAPLDAYNHRAYSGQLYASCAVVGNSGILLGSGHGSRIDGHSLVIRLNNARIAGYQDDVGGKTSISFLNSNVLHLCFQRVDCFCQPYGDSVPIVMYVCQASHFVDYVVCNSSHKAPLLVTDARFDALCARIVKYYSLKLFVEETRKHPAEWIDVHDEKLFHYSSGMQAVILALGICKQVSVFGFGKSKAAKHHYHTNQKMELGLHDFRAEYAFYKDLVERPQVVPFLKNSSFKIPPVTFYN
ncbi:hypothetical protein HPP92_011222 [Vanilla planifolia]|uniref:Uncharacterized protein n=1 Tax=Vanilla planifolia TaxID=51239 RepID=A0A835RB34_VANPL|nr:hypothetical protein HPP92_011222 [Vanilla planifolia]